MQSRCRNLTSGKQSRQRGHTVQIDCRPADHVVSTRPNGNPIVGEFQAKPGADFRDVWKPRRDQLLIHVRKVQVHTRVLRNCHLFCDCLTDDVSGCEFRGLVVFRHKPMSATVEQMSPLTAHRLCNQMPRAAGDVKDRRVKLHELHVAKFGSRASGDGMSVRRGNGRVGCFSKQPSCTAGRQHDLLGPDDCLAVFRVPDDRPDATAFMSQQVDRESAFPDTATFS